MQTQSTSKHAIKTNKPAFALLRSQLPRVLQRVALLCIILSSLAPFVRAQGESCPTDGVEVGFQGTVCGIGNFFVSLNGVVATGNNTKCLFVVGGDFTFTSTNKAYVKLKVDETYTVTSGTGICVNHINFEVPPDYTLFIDGIETKTISKTNGGQSFSGDGTWKVVLRKKCPCKKGNPKLGSVGWEAGLGNLTDGRSAEHISIQEKFLSSGIYTPSALVYSPPAKTNEVEVIRTANVLRQIKAPQTFVDVVTINSSEYDIRYYRPADVGPKVNGVYTLTGQPYLTWKIKNPEPATTTKLLISKIEGSVTTEQSEYTWDPSIDSWTLKTGWSAGTGTYARSETKTISYPTDSSRTETFVVKEANGQVVSKIAKTYMTFPWGESLVQEVVDPDAAALTTTYSYYETPSEDHRYRKIKTIIFPDGSWEKYDYDFWWNISTIMRPWKDLSIESATPANSHITIYGYTNSDNGVFGTSGFLRIPFDTEEQIGAVTVRKTRINRSIASVDPEPIIGEALASYSDADNGHAINLITQTITNRYHYSATQFLANRVESVVHPDGTKESYTYEKGNYVPNADPSLSQFVPDANGLAERETIIHGTTTSANGVAFKTTKDVIVRDQRGNEVLRETYVYNGTDYERFAWAAMDYDDRGYVVMSRNHKGEITSAVWTGDLKTSETAASGIETTYTYDSLNRIKTQTKKGVAAGGGFPAQNDIVTTFSYDAEGRQTSEVVTGGSLSLSTSFAYDKAGRITKETNQAGLNTAYSYPNGGRTQIITSPGGATQITDRYLDGQTKSVTGSAIVAQAFDYGVNADGTRFTQEFTGAAGLNSPRWTKTTIDWLDRTVSAEKPSFTGTNVVQTSFYNTLGQLQKQTTTAGTTKLVADTLYEYDELGRELRSGLDMNTDGVLTLVSTDRLTDTETIFEKVNADWFSVTSTRNYLTNNNDTPTVDVERQRLNNLPLNGTEQITSELTLTNFAGNSTKTTTAVDRAAKKQITTIDTHDSNINSVSLSINGLMQSATATTPLAATTYAYDSLGRLISTADPRGAVTTQSHSATTGQVISTTDGAGTTTYEYYPTTHNSAGRLKTQTNAAGKKLYFNYNSRGDMVQTWGDTTYPLEYVYDTYGQRTELHTFRGGQNWAASVWPSTTTGVTDVTKWTYQESTGLLTQKQDATLKGAVNTYDELGQIKTRVWARGVTCTYGYDANTAEMRTITYSDSTPAVSFAYDRAGRQTTITDAAGSRTRTFTGAGELQTEQIAGGILDGVSFNVGYDSLQRRNSLQTSHGANTLSSQTYGYDATSRLETITSGSHTATYTYYPNSGLLNTTAFTGGTNISRSYDTIGRLETITTTPAADTVQSHHYTYNNLSQRTRLTREDGSYWSYIYNDRGELVSGKKYWSDNSIVWGAQTEYSFDNIGNRNYAKNGGNQHGSLRLSNYTTNSLNQYLQQTVPGAVDVTGTANTAATVSVNNESTVRKGDYFYKELAVDNGTAPTYTQINVVGARNNFGAGGQDAVTEKGGQVFVPQNPETFTYDFDGNLTSDGRWTFTWDAENRLVEMEALSQVPVAARIKLTFIYDYANRRIQKAVSLWNSSTTSYELQSVTRFIYDGWNLVAEIDNNANLKRRFVWSADLLWMVENNQTFFVSTDGNDNVSTLIEASTNAIRGSYDYSPFGETVKSVGEYADQNPFRFSSKYTDTESGLTYYGYRYYSSQLGRWLGRDPAQEQGGMNLYGLLSNDSINAVDHLGLWQRDGNWTGGWYRYSGKAIAECNDELNVLADMITGDPNDWKLLGINPKIREGQRVNIAPLLREFENKIRYKVVIATALFNAAVFVRDDYVGSSATFTVNTFFSERAMGNADCNKAVKLVLAKGLIDVLKRDEFDELGYTYLRMPSADKDGEPEQMLLGDTGFINNYADYLERHPGGDWQGENIVKVGPGRYWGFGAENRIKSIAGWETELRARYNQGLTTPRTDRIPGFTKKILFLNPARIGMQVFDLRKSKMGR